MKIRIKSKDYEILIIEKRDGSRFALIAVSNKYESGSVWKRLDDLLRGKFKDPLEYLSNGGYFGLGNVTVSADVLTVDNKLVEVHLGSRWRKIMDRAHTRTHCSDSNIKFYKNVHVSNEWMSFQNFGKWVCDIDKSNFRPGYDIDKDILGDGTIYSSSTCVYIPRYLNRFIATFNRIDDHNLHIFNTKFKYNDKSDVVKYKMAALRLMSLEYYKHNMIPKTVYLKIMDKYIDDDIVYNTCKYDELHKHITENIEKELELYPKVIKISFRR